MRLKSPTNTRTTQQDSAAAMLMAPRLQGFRKQSLLNHAKTLKMKTRQHCEGAFGCNGGCVLSHTHTHRNTGNTGTTIIPKEAWTPLMLSDANDLGRSAGWEKKCG